ncbi:hypothetical protein CAEBREN_12057 [Caenorhabditis brenneri]|uniref:DUF7809 domain-containing protein n=1 Tax=Caenorhabditis brenneri TaxID=135651 RepID=G0MWY7_CAEBE|nr:hypothetical protein CAEBREN_12057 [Caenorhabditis brenneri]
MLQSREKYIDDLSDLPAALRSYIPKQLLKNVKIKDCWNMFNELGYIQNLLDNSNDNWRMYGSAESLLKNLKVYMKFPLSRKMFPRGMRRYYNAIPNSYQTLKKEVLYCKQDFLFYLQCCVYEELELHDDEHKVGYAELVDYMKNHEKRLSGCYEFVKYDHDVFEDIRKSFICSRSLHVFPENPENAVLTGNPRPYEEKNFVKVFDNLISKYPSFFLPNSETKNNNATAVVRIFDDGNLKFVMESELFAAINLKNPDQKPLECMDVEGHYKTIEYKHVLERYRDKIAGIDKYRYFINLKLFQKLREELEELWKPIEDKPMKRVRDVGPQGFTVEDLKKELKYLGYTKFFPEITADAGAVYTLFHSQKPSYLKTCDLFAAVHGVITCVLTKRFPCLSEFMYRQKVCMHNRAKPCDDCLEAINETEAIVEAEIKAETEQASSSVTAATSGDGAKNEEDSEESEPESVTSQGLSVPRSNSKELQISIALSPVKTKTKPSSAILESEVPEHCQVLSVSTTEICLRLHVHEEKSNKSVEMEKKIKDLEKEAEEWKKMHFKVLEENIALDSQVKEKNEQLKLAQKALQENEQKFKELEKAVKKQRQELTKFEKSVKQESKNLKSKMNGLLSQLVEKDIEIDELKKENLDDYKKFEAFNLDLERRLNVELEQQKDHKKEIEQLKRNASTSADELKKLTAKIAEKEAAEDLLKRSNKGAQRIGTKSSVRVHIVVESNSIRMSFRIFNE